MQQALESAVLMRRILGFVLSMRKVLESVVLRKISGSVLSMGKDLGSVLSLRKVLVKLVDYIGCESRVDLVSLDSRENRFQLFDQVLDSCR